MEIEDVDTQLVDASNENEQFENALKFTNTLLCRLRVDPCAVDQTYWVFEKWQDLLWALQQQSLQVYIYIYIYIYCIGNRKMEY